MIQINSLFNESGTFILSNYGKYKAFMFQGDFKFISRAKNLCLNYGICGRGEFFVYERREIYGQTTCYCLTPVERLMAGLELAFLNEKQCETGAWSGEELSYPIEIEQLAKNRAQQFFDERIEKNNLIVKN